MPTTNISTFTLESGTALHDAPVAYRTWGRLNARADNAVLVCHALTGSPDAADWWGGLIGPGRALDPARDFIVCAGALGSPYGTASPLTDDPATDRPYGPAFPRVTIRDTVALHRRLLERLGVHEVALAIGGSMGGMNVLEWAFEEKADGTPLVRTLAPIAVNGRHAAWQIGWSEAQRQALYADPRWNDGRYPRDAPPSGGLAAARAMAMVSYRSHGSFGSRFGRGRMPPENGRADASADGPPPFAVESYLRYQGRKLAERFDANCYVRLTQQMDSHDVARGRGTYEDVLCSIHQPALVVGVTSDVLYPLEEQRELAEHLPHATLDVLDVPHGHDAFLIETDLLDERLHSWRAQHDVGAPASFQPSNSR